MSVIESIINDLKNLPAPNFTNPDYPNK